MSYNGENDIKTVLCFGDSNTHGDRPDAPGRFSWRERWTGLLQQRLGDSYHVIEEGLNGRTTVWEDEIEGDKSGKKQLPSCIMSHAPVDVLVLMLGTNDFKRKFSLTPTDIAWAIEALIKVALTTDNEREQPPQILLAAPTYLGEKTFLGEIIGNRKEDSLRLGGLLREVAERYHIGFINIAEVAGPSELDGMHFDAEGHRKIAAAMEKAIRAMI